MWAPLQLTKSKEGMSPGLHTLRAEEPSPLPGILLMLLITGGRGSSSVFQMSEVINCCLFFRTPLHYAAANCHFHCIETLVTTGANVNETDDWGRTALHYAAASDMDRK